MKLNTKGLVEADSVRNAQRVVIKRKESETIKLRLVKTKIQQKVEIGQVAVISAREFLRVDSRKFKGYHWIEIE